MSPALLWQTSEKENECKHKNLSQHIVNGIQQYIKMKYIMKKGSLSQEYKKGSIFENQM